MQKNNRRPKEVLILVVDNEALFRKLLPMALQRMGYTVYAASSGLEALQLFIQIPFELVLIDLVLPDMDGYTLCAELRKRSIVPILLISGLNHLDDIIHGFNVGADAYITKPFHISEVKARMQALLRRTAELNPHSNPLMIRDHDIVINSNTYEVYIRGELVHLTPTEFQLLDYMAQKPDRPISKKELIQSVWRQELSNTTNLVEVTIRRLREKLEENPSQPIYLLTVRGAGYQFNPDGINVASM